MSSQWLLFLSIFGWGIGSFFYKKANDTMHPLMVTTMVTILYMLVTPLAFSFLKFDKTITTPGVIWSVIGGACACVGSLCYFFMMRGGAGAGEATALTSVYPALTLALSCLFLGEPLTVKKGAGIALAILSCIVLGLK